MNDQRPVVIRLSGVRVVRAGSAILDGVDWVVHDGERWAVLGPNGAGKTTLLQVVAAQLHPTSGAAQVLGETLGGVDVFELRPRIGVSSAALGDRIPGDERVLDVVVTAGWAVVGRWAEEYQDGDLARAHDLLAQLGCRSLVDRRYGTLSEGERKRVQIARALMTDPELLLLDEPAAGLDLGAREALLRRLTRVVASPASPVTVLVTHHVEEIPIGVTHALLLRAGRVVAAGPVVETLTAGRLSAAFGLPLEVERVAGRYHARAAVPHPPTRRPVGTEAHG